MSLPLIKQLDKGLFDKVETKIHQYNDDIYSLLENTINFHSLKFEKLTGEDNTMNNQVINNIMMIIKNYSLFHKDNLELTYPKILKPNLVDENFSIYYNHFILEYGCELAIVKEDYEQLAKYYDQFKSSEDTYIKRRTKARKFYYQGKLSSTDSNLTTELKYYKNAEDICVKKTDLRFYNKILNAIGVTLGKLGKFSEAKMTFAKIIEHNSSKVIDIERTKGYNNLSIIANFQNNFQEGLSYIDYGLDICKKHNLDRLRSFLLTNRANILLNQEKYSAARHTYAEQVMIFRESQNLNNLSRALLNLGLAEMRLENLNNAKSVYEEIVPLIDHMPDHRKLRFYINYAEISLQLKDLDTALNYITQAEELNKRNKLFSQEGKLQHIIGKIHLYKGKPKEAQKALKNAIQILSTTKEFQKASKVYYNYSLTYILEGKFYKALMQLNEAEKIFEVYDNILEYSRLLLWKIQLYILLDYDLEQDIKPILRQLQEFGEEKVSSIVVTRIRIAEKLVNITRSTVDIQNKNVITDLKFVNTEKYEVSLILLPLLTSWLLDDEENEKKRIFSSFQEILAELTTTLGSKFYQCNMYLIEAYLERQKGNYEIAENYLVEAKELALEGGYGHQLTQITCEEMRNSRITLQH